MEYEQDIEIDVEALDAEWLDHSRRMFVYCSHAAESHRDMDFSKERLDVVKAEIDQRVRANPDQYGLSPGSRGITEGSIQSTVLTQPEYQEATRDYLQKKYEYEVAQGAVRAFDHRKSALENLVRLHGQSYFAGPAVPHELSDLRQQRDAQRRDRDAAVQSRVKVRRRT